MTKSAFKKCKLYKGENLTGEWTATIKIDGVRAFVTSDGVFSRANKPLYNLDFLVRHAPLDIEVFCNSWEETITKVRSKNQIHVIEMDQIFILDPYVDPRLIIDKFFNPTKDDILSLLKKQNDIGHEGLVLRNDTKWLKVKPFETYDVPITGIIEGTGKYVGALGSFETAMGNVGTGFTDEQRKLFFTPGVIGTIIEVVCMELTKDGQFRHPVFKRMRYDK